MLEGTGAASEDEMASLSVTFNIRMRQLYEEPSWIKLFRSINTDNSGQISFAELLALTRDEQFLHLMPAEVSDEQIKAFWVALDTDKSGCLTCGEFGAFMRKGEHVLHPHKTWKERLEERNKRSAKQLRATREARHARAGAAPSGVPPATEELVTALATLCAARVDERGWREEGESDTHTWFALFKRIDTENSGQVGYAGWCRLVRALGVSESDVGASELAAVWHALDPSGLGFVRAGEWAAFMRRGAPPAKAVVSESRMRFEFARRQHIEVLRHHDEVLAAQLRQQKEREHELRRLNVAETRVKGRQTLDRARDEIAAQHRAAHQEVVARVDQTELKAALKKAPQASDDQVVQLAEECNYQLMRRTD